MTVRSVPIKNKKRFRILITALNWTLLDVLIGVGTSLLILAFVVAGFESAPKGAPDIVSVSTVAERISPNRHCMARLVETTDQTDYLVTTITCELYLASVGNPSDKIGLLVADTGPDVDERPKFSWTSSNTLSVIVRSMPDITVERRDYKGVHVDLRAD